MPLQIVRNDITKMKCDAIVNAANETLLGGGGVDGAIHRAAGKELLEECRTLGGCKTGEAKITKGYNLPASYVIHTVGPVWHGGLYDEEALLRSCYGKSLELAAENGCESVAFPLISCGVFGYPTDRALRVASDEIMRFLMKHDMLVYIVIFDRSSLLIGEKLFSDISSYIDDSYAGLSASAPMSRRITENYTYREADFSEFTVACAAPGASLDDILGQIDESFSEMLLRKIDEKGMTDSECYKKANIDRKLFSKIRANPDYKPSKSTALAFAIALELPPDEVREPDRGWDFDTLPAILLDGMEPVDGTAEKMSKNWKNKMIFTVI